MQIEDKVIIKILNILYDEGAFGGITLDFKNIVNILMRNKCLTSVDKCPKCGFPLFNLDEEIMNSVKCCECGETVQSKTKKK